VARRFGLDEGLITPASVAEAGLKAARSPNLTLRTDKLSAALGEPPPDLSTGIEHFYTQYQQGYPQFLKGIGGKG
jgi:dTDP-4-dehydrorhamnose reductase